MRINGSAQADILNAEMIQKGVDLDALLVPLHEYQRFIGQGGRSVLASYPHLYLFRWNVLKYYELLFASRVLNERAIDEHYAGAEQAIERIVEFDSAAGNRYGLLRARVLALLLGAVKQPLRAVDLEELRGAALEGGYGFEARLLRQLQAPEGLLPVDLRTVLRFYPFVHQ